MVNAPGGDSTEHTLNPRPGLRASPNEEVTASRPNHVRHNAATVLRKEFRLDAACVILGHTSAAVTEIYAKMDRKKAAEIMGVVG